MSRFIRQSEFTKRELAEVAFKEVGLNGEDYIVVDQCFGRPGDASESAVEAKEK